MHSLGNETHKLHHVEGYQGNPYPSLLWFRPIIWIICKSLLPYKYLNVFSTTHCHKLKWGTIYI